MTGFESPPGYYDKPRNFPLARALDKLIKTTFVSLSLTKEWLAIKDRAKMKSRCKTIVSYLAYSSIFLLILSRA